MIETTVTPSRYQRQPISNALDLLATPVLERFRAIIADPNTGQELAKVARFGVRINPCPLLQSWNNILSDMVLLCESSEYPGRGFEPAEARYYGPAFKVPTQSVYPDITMSYLCRTLFYEREFFDFWMNKINPPNTYDFAYPSEYQTTIDIFQFGEDMKCKYAWQLQKAFPINLNPQQVTWADDQVVRLGVQLAYTRWIPLVNKDINPDLKPPSGFQLAKERANNQPSGF